MALHRDDLVRLQDVVVNSCALYDVVDARTLVLRLEDYQVHDVASVLRRFIRSLDEPLLTDALRSRWVETSGEFTLS